jgi:hypothetical protein
MDCPLHWQIRKHLQPVSAPQLCMGSWGIAKKSRCRVPVAVCFGIRILRQQLARIEGTCAISSGGITSSASLPEAQWE